MAQRGLPVSEPDHRERGIDHREVRDAAADVSEGAQEEPVSEPVADRQVGQPPDGDREGGTGEDENPDGHGGGNRLDGIGVQLSEETTEQDLSEAEEQIVSALSLPALPTAKAQIRKIEERMAALYAGEIPISADVVDDVLRKGGNKRHSHLRIIYNFMIDQSPEEYTEFVRREYGTGGMGLTIGGMEYSVWYDELGMQIAVGHTVNDRILDKVFLSWGEVAARIHQLLRQGEYAPQVVLDAQGKMH